MPNDIIPWKCHICNGEFDTPDGGICSRCNRATCRDHLYQLGARKMDATWVCQECLTSEEKIKNKVKMKNKEKKPGHFEIEAWSMLLFSAIVIAGLFCIVKCLPYYWKYSADQQRVQHENAQPQTFDGPGKSK
jgi:hypothetical protein